MADRSSQSSNTQQTQVPTPTPSPVTRAKFRKSGIILFLTD